MPRRRSPRTWLLATVGVLGMLLLTGCDTLPRFGWPTGITSQGNKMQIMWSWAVVAALAVGAVVWGMTAWTVAFHRKKKGTDNADLPRQTAYNLPVELMLAAAPFVAIAVLFYYTIVTQDYVETRKPNPDVTVNVTAFKWNWEFQYPGHTDSTSNTTVETVGSTEEIPILVLPAGERVKFNLHSDDVIHSFWVIDFDFKLDVIPGPPPTAETNNFEVNINKGTEGAYVGRCAELCGTYHAQMNFELRVVTPSQYDAYITAREGGMTTAQALRSIGEAPTAQTTKPYDPSRTNVTDVSK